MVKDFLDSDLRRRSSVELLSDDGPLDGGVPAEWNGEDHFGPGMDCYHPEPVWFRTIDGVW